MVLFKGKEQTTERQRNNRDISFEAVEEEWNLGNRWKD